MQFNLYFLKVSANCKIAMQCFENFGGPMPQMPPPDCAPMTVIDTTGEKSKFIYPYIG